MGGVVATPKIVRQIKSVLLHDETSIIFFCDENDLYLTEKVEPCHKCFLKMRRINYSMLIYKIDILNVCMYLALRYTKTFEVFKSAGRNTYCRNVSTAV